ncbi:SOS response-associated peptidase [Belnapia moabensis]|uniref:SOS response-associated peptidase n=1 Tax=Belnapia moabensis TaxID=365533 RepID=UPI0005B85DDF|nr:SOS response-associated peptidase family protein [Belnapia moabensis]
MCGRLISNLPVSTIADLLDAKPAEGVIEPRFNLAPRGIAPMVCVDKRPGSKDRGRRVLIPATFAISVPEPAWKAIKKRRPAYDTRTEEVPSVKSSALKKAPWADLLHHRRGIVAVSGYYDWTVPHPNLPHHKHVHAVVRQDGSPMLLACLYDDACEQRRGADVRFSVVTVEAKGHEAAPNGWMPAILQSDDIVAWIGDAAAEHDLKQLSALLRPAADGVLRRYRVANAVGNAANDGEWLLQPIDRVTAIKAA